MTKQEIFEKVAKHLIKQNKKALDFSGLCLYETKEGLRCAVGCLIPDGCTGLKFKGNISKLFYKFPDLKELITPSDLEGEKGVDFLERLQRIHDDYNPTEWDLQLKNFAFKYNLTIY